MQGFVQMWLEFELLMWDRVSSKCFATLPAGKVQAEMPEMPSAQYICHKYIVLSQIYCCELLCESTSWHKLLTAQTRQFSLEPDYNRRTHFFILLGPKFAQDEEES